MPSFLDTLLQDNILTQRDDNMYVCVCGSVLSKNSIRRHVLTNAHTTFMRNNEILLAQEVENEPENIIKNIDNDTLDDTLDNTLDNVPEDVEQTCGICYEPFKNYVQCIVCKNKCCVSCSAQIVKSKHLKCPYCRNKRSIHDQEIILVDGIYVNINHLHKIAGSTISFEWNKQENYMVVRSSLS